MAPCGDGPLAAVPSHFAREPPRELWKLVYWASLSLSRVVFS